jgi:hypothetical protein
MVLKFPIERYRRRQYHKREKLAVMMLAAALAVLVRAFNDDHHIS